MSPTASSSDHSPGDIAPSTSAAMPTVTTNSIPWLRSETKNPFLRLSVTSAMSISPPRIPAAIGVMRPAIRSSASTSSVMAIAQACSLPGRIPTVS